MLGDYIDCGLDSRGVIEQLIAVRDGTGSARRRRTEPARLCHLMLLSEVKRGQSPLLLSQAVVAGRAGATPSSQAGGRGPPGRRSPAIKKPKGG